jgi:hypothetical protein
MQWLPAPIPWRLPAAVVPCGRISTARGQLIVGASARPWVTPERPIETPWVSVPGLLTAQCTSNENATTSRSLCTGDPSDPRTDDIGGDLVTAGQLLADWGLHLIDVNLAMGNLVDIVTLQGRAWARRASR